MLASGAALILASPLRAGAALLGASDGSVEPPQPVPPPDHAPVGAFVLSLSAAAVLTLGAVYAARRFGLFRLAPVSAEDRKPDWPVLLLAGMAILLAQPIGAGTVRAAFPSLVGTESGLRATALMAIGGYLGALLGLVAIGLGLRGLFRRIGAVPLRRDFVWGLIGILLAAPGVVLVGQVALWAASWLARLRGMSLPEPNAHATLRLLTDDPGKWGGWWWALVGAVVVGAPIAEEFVYRGFLQSALRTVTGSRWGAILAASGVFALMHAGVAEWHALAVLFALSVAFGLAYERTGRLWVPVTMHALFNAGNVVGALLLAE